MYNANAPLGCLLQGCTFRNIDENLIGAKETYLHIIK